MGISSKSLKVKCYNGVIAIVHLQVIFQKYIGNTFCGFNRKKIE